MVMTLNLDYWETYSLTAGCNLLSKNFKLCVQNVRSVAEQQFVQIYLNNNHSASAFSSSSTNSNSNSNYNNNNNNYRGNSRKTTAMYFHEPEKSLVPTETFLATAVPKLLVTSLIIFLNILAIITLIRSNRWTSSFKSSSVYSIGHPSSSSSNTIQRNLKRSTRANANYFILPQSTQGLLHSLFTNYLLFGLVTLYSQISLSVFLLGDNVRLVDDQGKECLVVNCILITLSCSVALHLISLAVDRTLASSLSFKKYTSMSQGTVPLWLLSIWLPSIILGVLPLAGWRKMNFSFCVFIYQFNDDYLRFIAIFFLTCICLIPFLYIYFLIFLKSKSSSTLTTTTTGGGGSNYNTYNSNNFNNHNIGSTNTIEPTTQTQQPRVVVYRWYRKLQAHHRLTFSLILVINILCWCPFHIYLLMACQSCPYSELSSNGFILEYLFMITLTPALIIPLMFSLRSSFMEKCASKIVRCVTFKSDFYGDAATKIRKNPLSRSHQQHYNASTMSVLSASSPPYHPHKSSLFFIDDLQAHHHQVQQQQQQQLHSSSNTSFSSTSFPTPTTSRGDISGGSLSLNSSTNNIIMKSNEKETNNNTFFVPHYLPKEQIEFIQEKKSRHSSSSRRHPQNHHRHQSTLSAQDAQEKQQYKDDKIRAKGGIIVPVQVHHNNNNYNTMTNSVKKKKKKRPAPIPSNNTNGYGSITNKYKSSFKNKHDSYSQNKTLPLRHLTVYLNNGAEFNNETTTTATGGGILNSNTSSNNNGIGMGIGINDCCGGGGGGKSNELYKSGSSEYFGNNNVHQYHHNAHDHTYDSLESDMKYGFPIIHKNETNENNHIYKNNNNDKIGLNNDGGTIMNRNSIIMNHNVNNKNLGQQRQQQQYYDEKRHGIYYNSDDNDDDGLLRASAAIVHKNNNTNNSTTAGVVGVRRKW